MYELIGSAIRGMTFRAVKSYFFAVFLQYYFAVKYFDVYLQLVSKKA